VTDIGVPGSAAPPNNAICWSHVEGIPNIRKHSAAGSPAAATDRFFRAYYRHSIVPDQDKLFYLLNPLYSLNDKLGKSSGTSLHRSASFTVLRKLRKLFHHEAELPPEVRLIHAGEIPTVVGDPAFVCLVRRSLIAQSSQDERKRGQRSSDGFREVVWDLRRCSTVHIQRRG
jgi:hypothetical protein